MRQSTKSAVSLLYRLSLVLCVVALCACAKQPTPEMASPSAADAQWNAYTALSQSVVADTLPYRMQLSLRYNNTEDSRRVTAILWGNDNKALRLDVNAGIGVTVASILEDDSHFMLYAPREDKAYFHQGSQKPLLEVGVPLPLGVRDLALLLNGDMVELFGQTYSGTPTLDKDGAIAYPISGRLQGKVHVNPAGQVVLWEQQPTADGVWAVELTYPTPESATPDKIKVNHTKGKKAIILVKERNNPARPFTEQQLRLTIPQGTTVLPLQRSSVSRQL